MQERETLRAENKRLQAMEKQYINSMQKLSFEKEQLEQEKRKLQVLQQQQLTVANQFDRKMKIQIEELELQKVCSWLINILQNLFRTDIP